MRSSSLACSAAFLAFSSVLVPIGCGNGASTTTTSGSGGAGTSTTTSTTSSSGTGSTGGTGGTPASSSSSSSVTSSSSSGTGGAAPGALVDVDLGSGNWVRIPGLSSGAAPSGVAVDPSGNVIVAGSVCGEIDFGNGDQGSGGDCAVQSIFVAKYTPAGALAWSKTYPSQGPQYEVYNYPLVGSVTTDASGNIILVGDADGGFDFGGGALMSPYVVELDPSGNTVFGVEFSANQGGVIGGVALDPSGDIAVTGTFAGTIHFGATTLVTTSGHPAMFVAKLDPMGVPLWAQSYVAGYTDASYTIAVDATSGDVALGGGYSASVDFGTGALPAPAPTGDDWGFVVRFDGTGQALFALPLEAPLAESPMGLAFDAAGDLFWSGTMKGATVGGPFTVLYNGNFSGNTFVSGIDPTGNVLWTEDLQTQDTPEMASGQAGGLAVDASGKVIVSSWFDVSATPLCPGMAAPPAGEQEIGVIALDATGACVGSKVFAKGTPDPVAVAAGVGEVVVTGAFSATTVFGTTAAAPPSTLGDEGMFTAKLSAF